MSRFWNTQDEKYIYSENLKLRKNTVESLINRINANIQYELNIANIMDTYQDKLDNLIKGLKEKDIDYFSPTYNKKTYMYTILDNYISRSIKELTNINNKLINPKYKSISNSKLILLLIKENIDNYNLIIRELQELKLINNY